MGWSAADALVDADSLGPVLLVSAAVLVVCIVAVRLTARSGLPTLLAYLAVGLVLGEGGLGINFSSAEIGQVLGYSALILILAEGGLTTRWSSIRNAVAPAVTLSTVGVVVSVFVTAAAAHWLLGWSWQVSLLVGAIVSSTDAAAVFSVLRTVPLPRRISGMLEAESGFNDAPVVMLVVAITTSLANPAEAQPWWMIGILAVVQLSVGTVIGAAVGYVGGGLLRRTAAATSGLFAIGVVSVSVLAFGAATVVGTSGFIACYVAALVMGNMSLPHRSAMLGFAESVGWLAQIGLFVMLGLLASPSGFVDQLTPALVLGLVLLLLARPVSVIVSLTPFRVGWRDQVFLSWAGLRGAVPVVLATVPVTVGVDGVSWIFDLVFVLVVLFTLIQAPSLPWVARHLGVTESGHTQDLTVESEPLESIDADLVEVAVEEGSRLHGVQVFELRLPKGANVALIVRDDGSFVPSPTTPIRVGDQLLVVSSRGLRSEVERRVRAVSRHGRLAGWIPEPSGSDAR
ncbi:potassium/proton antiporter [Marihabitans asiaticum]|uniref:Potassium/proton antiporter (CPA1 family) n=1 Tax=Marihabitans asiaticum TaxID=415218 RepID=A0A560WHD6_9MICO|nr:potassium/proton antiporter [Marihabitans asiaticum]TWD17101.1 potassium/proton antiporter (CPA1 family) [Marihabitans asiaticum]